MVSGVTELLIKYVLDHHRQDLMLILEAEDQELHYSVIVQYIFHSMNSPKFVC